MEKLKIWSKSLKVLGLVAVGSRSGHLRNVREIWMRRSLERSLVAVHSNNDLNSLIKWHLLRARIIMRLMP